MTKAIVVVLEKVSVFAALRSKESVDVKFVAFSLHVFFYTLTTGCWSILRAQKFFF